MKNHPNTVRIISGQWRGSVVYFNQHEGLRPTGVRIRATLFNWLQHAIHQSVVVDLYAGTGVLGFEALSRACAYVYFSDIAGSVCQKITTTAQRLQAKNYQIDCLNAKQRLQALAENTIDIAFVDPPFGKGLQQDTLAWLTHYGVLKNGAYVYVEGFDVTALSQLGIHYTLVKEKIYGNISYALLQYQR